MKATPKNLETLKDLREHFRTCPDGLIDPKLHHDTVRFEVSVSSGDEGTNSYKVDSLGPTNVYGGLTKLAKYQVTTDHLNDFDYKTGMYDLDYDNYLYDTLDGYNCEDFDDYRRNLVFYARSPVEFSEDECDSRSTREVALDRLDILIADIEYDLEEKLEDSLDEKMAYPNEFPLEKGASNPDN